MSNGDAPADGWLNRDKRPFADALALCRVGRFDEARAICRQILEREPEDVDAVHLDGLAACQLGAIADGIDQLRRAAALNGAIPVLHYNLAEVLRGTGGLDEAAAHYHKALALAPNFADALANLGNTLLRLGRTNEAAAALRRAIALAPSHAAAHDNLGSALLARGEAEAAEAVFRRALALDPDFAEAHYNRGNTLLALKRHEEALASFDRALELQPGLAPALHNRGTALLELDRHADALASFDRALAIVPHDMRALSNRGNALLRLGRREEALASYELALALKPDFVEALYNRGDALFELKRYDAAIASFSQALAVEPDLANALHNRGTAQLELDRYAEAAEDFAHLLRVDPDHAYARGSLLHARLIGGDWTDYGREIEIIAGDIAAGNPASPPFMFLNVPGNAAGQLACAALYSRDRHPPAREPVWRGERYSHERIRLAYVSADFGRHAVMYSLAQVLGEHDRARFETVAVSFSPPSADPFRRRLEASVERFIDVRERTDREVAALLRELEIDIAVDLMGYSKSCRPGIFALRPAPVQVNYLGYLGTMAADYIDYIVADPVVIPAGEQPFYTEKIAYLPETFLPTDATRRVGARAPTRAEAGLPDTGFVFCSFNHTYKITPPVFAVWMRLLRQVEGSVLWLLGDDARSAGNRRDHARQHGIDPERLVFAGRLQPDEHLARHRLADLFLDTLPYNAGATATDALWAGLPLVTCRGSSFVGRMAASQLGAVGLAELAAADLAEYEALALRLARDPPALAAVRHRLAQNRLTHPLFDTGRYRRHLEAAYQTMWARAQHGQPPETFAVPPLP